MEHYTVKLQELGGSSFLSILHLDKIKRMPNASPFLIGTDHWQIPVSEGKHLFSVFLDIYSPDFFHLNILKSDRYRVRHFLYIDIKFTWFLNCCHSNTY